MKHHIGITIDSKLFGEIETLREREKRSIFIEHLIKLGLKAYKKRKKLKTQLSPSRKKKVINHPFAYPIKSAGEVVA